MTTPNRAEIIAKAQQLYFANCRGEIPNLPEVSELREEGYMDRAKTLLMCAPTVQELESWKSYSDQTKSFSFDPNEAMQTTTFISGSRGVGKSDVSMYAVDQLKADGITCVVFDGSLDWIRRSSVSRYMTIQPYSLLEVPTESTILDISRLTPMEQQRTVESFCKILFDSQLRSDKRYYLVFEEAQTFFPLNSLRNKGTQQSMRVLSVGRNIRISVCAISQFPALIDKELIKHAGQIYVGYCSEPNTLKYWKGIFGRKTSKLKNLANGQFLYYHRNHLGKTEIAPYQKSAVKKQITSPQEFQPLPNLTTPRNGRTLKPLFVTILSAIAIALGLSQLWSL